MRNRAVRVALALVFLLGTIAAAYVIVTAHAASRAALAAQAAIDGELDTIALAIAELRASQQAYVAAGQGEGYWISRVSERLASVRADLAAFAGQVTSDEARNRLHAAATRLEDFEQMDRRAGEYARGGQRLLASDLIFADGLEMTRAAQDEVAAAQAAERAQTESVLRAADRRQAIAAAGTGAAALLIILLLTSSGRATKTAAVEQTPSGAQPETRSGLGLALDPELARLDRRLAEPPPSPVQIEDVTRAADLCADLARVHEPRHLAALLERTARVLDAAGVIVWMADPDRRELVPTLTYGYQPYALARFGTIARDADNATAAAFREGTLKTVAADAPASGAIVAPLVTPSGCVGVMAAEVTGERERDPATRALARIIAAQIAALVGAPPVAVRAARAAEA